MAKAGIHPEQHNIAIELSDGTKIDVATTYGKAGEVLKLDIDPTNHPAWQDGNKAFVNVNDDRISKFNKKFGSFNFGVKSEETEEKK